MAIFCKRFCRHVERVAAWPSTCRAHPYTVPPGSRPSRDDERQIPPVESGVEVGIEAGEVIEDLHTGVHGLLAPTSHIGHFLLQ